MRPSRGRCYPALSDGELAAERLNVPAIQQQVATDLAGRTNPVLADLTARSNAQAGKLSEQATELAALQKRLDSLNASVASAQATLAENTRLLDRWQNLISEARLTAADQGIARVVWFILRTESFLLGGAVLLSLLALLVSLTALLRHRKQIPPSQPPAAHGAAIPPVTPQR